MASGRERFPIISDGLPSQLPDIDPERDRRVAGVARRRDQRARPRPRPLPDAPAAGEGARAAGRRPQPAQHRLRQHDPARGRALVPRRRAHRAADPGLHPLERGDHGLPGQPPRARRRRPHRHLRLGGQPLRGRLQPLLPRQGGRRSPATRSSSRATPRPASTPARSSRAGSARASSTASARSCRTRATACPATRTRGSCRTSGSSRPSRWASARSTRSTRRASTATCSTAQIKDTSRSHVWAFLGDGEMDEPESLGAIGLAAREELDNLTFVINCNLQRLDGPVRGNGKIIQELESYFRGAGWNVIKVIWGREWDPLLAQDTDGVLVNQMNTTPGRPVPDLLRRVRRVHPRALLRRRPAAAPDGRALTDDQICPGCRAAATTTARCTRRSRPPASTSASRR